MQITVLGKSCEASKAKTIETLINLIPNSIVIDSKSEVYDLLEFKEDDILEKIPYFGNLIAYVDDRKCIRCGICTRACNYESIFTGDVKEKTCTGCGACEAVCPPKAIELRKMKSADILILKRKDAFILTYKKYTEYFDNNKILLKLKKIAEEKRVEKETLILCGIEDTKPEIAASLLKSDALLITVDSNRDSIEKFLEILSVSYSFLLKRLLLVFSVSKDENADEIESEIRRFCQAEKLESCLQVDESLDISLKGALEKIKILKR